jgi:DNA-binding CsgD family transcriptional regulator
LREPVLAGFVLAGVAGVGKTRLASESERAAGEIGFSTIRVSTTRAAASIPFGPFAHLLPDPETVSGGLLGLLASASQAITQRADADKPLLLVVDDAHLLDDGSAALVHQLAQSAACKVLATIRTPGEAPDPITALWKDGLADRLDLDPLSEQEAAAFSAAVLGAPLEAVTCRQLWHTSGGNALYLRELLLGASASEALVKRDGIWIQRRKFAAPERLVELLSSRLQDLPPDVAHVLDVVAVAGTIGHATLERLSSSGSAEEAEAGGLIRVSQEGRRSEVRVAHPLYGEVRRQHMPQLTQRRIQGDLAGAMAETGARRRDDLLRLATWQLDAGIGDDPDILTRATLRARRVFDNSLAARIGQAAVDAGGGVEARRLLGEALFLSGRHAEAEEVLKAAATQCTTDEEVATIANARGYNFGVLMGQQQVALEVLHDALRRLTDPVSRSMLTNRIASMSLFAGDVVAAEEATRADRESQSIGPKCEAIHTASIALALMGRTSEARTMAAAGLEAHRFWEASTQIPEVQLIGSCLAAVNAGDLAEAGSLQDKGYRAVLEAGDREGVATFLLLKGLLSIDQGRLSTARSAFQEASAINRELHDSTALRWCLAGTALSEAMAGQAAAAEAALVDLGGLAEDGVRLFHSSLVERARPWCHAARGELSLARQELMDAADLAEKRHYLPARARLLHDLARLGAPQQAAEPLRELEASVEGPLVGVMAAHAEALVSRQGEALDRASLDFQAIGALALAAEAAASAASCFAGAGRRRQATAAARRANDLAHQAGGTWLTKSHDDSRQVLTGREYEVAGLAANGLTSKEIAARLYISVRTTDNHLQRVYFKLGVKSREELASVLGRGRQVQ